jgi:hypothetical protein
MRTVRRLGILLVMGLVGLGPGLVTSGTAHAAGITYYVATTGSDPGSCPVRRNTASTPFATIGFALNCAANDKTTASRPDTIQVAAGTYDEHNLTVNANVTIAGQPGQTTVDGQQRGTVLTINSGYTVTISGLTVTGGLACADSYDCQSAGGNYNLGTLTLSNTTASGNSACNEQVSNHSCGGANGEGINNAGTLSLSNSTVSGNIACNSFLPPTHLRAPRPQTPRPPGPGGADSCQPALVAPGSLRVLHDLRKYTV